MQNYHAFLKQETFGKSKRTKYVTCDRFQTHNHYIKHRFALGATLWMAFLWRKIVVYYTTFEGIFDKGFFHDQISFHVKRPRGHRRRTDRKLQSHGYYISRNARYRQYKIKMKIKFWIVTVYTRPNVFFDKQNASICTISLQGRDTPVYIIATNRWTLKYLTSLTRLCAPVDEIPTCHYITQ